MNLLYVIWNVEPEIFPHSRIHIRWYGLFFVVAFYLGYIIIEKMMKKEGKDVKLLDNLTIYMLVATIVGARLGHCLIYEPDYYLKYPLQILKVWEGGLASHGAAVAILIAIWLFSRKYKEFRFFWIIDRIVIVVALAGFWIRLGNLMNSEIIGKPTTLPWGFVFKKLEEFGITGPHHPSQLYEALSYLALFFVLFWYYLKKSRKPKEGVIFSVFLIALFTIRFLIEFLKENQVAYENNLVLNLGQLLSIPFILLGIGLLIYFNIKKNPAVQQETEKE